MLVANSKTCENTELSPPTEMPLVIVKFVSYSELSVQYVLSSGVQFHNPVQGTESSALLHVTDMGSWAGRQQCRSKIHSQNISPENISWNQLGNLVQTVFCGVKYFCQL